MNTPRKTYDSVAQAFHWGIALAILLMFPLAALMQLDIWPSEIRRALYTTHKTTGVLILIATFLRVGWLLIRKQPHLPPPGAMPAWQRFVAQIVHFSLYVLAIAVPLSGWAMVSAGPHGIKLFGVFSFPRLPVESWSDNATALGHFLHESHELLATVILAFVALHVAAALKHHFADRDDVLLKIVPASTWPFLNRLRGM